MSILVKNENWPLFLSLNILKLFGFLVTGTHTRPMKWFLKAYWLFWFNFIIGTYIIVQSGDLYQIWGDLPLMVSTSFLLFTNLALAGKLIVTGWRSKAVQGIIDEGAEEMRSHGAEARMIIEEYHRDSTVLFVLYIILTTVTVLGWAASAEKNSLPLRAWYPYDANLSPAFEITYAHQSIALSIAASLNVSFDTMVTTLIALCRCRLKLTALDLRNLCEGFDSNNNRLQNADEEIVIGSRLRVAVSRHQAALRSAEQIQECFTEPILVQFTVSLIIICVTAYQVAEELRQTPKNEVRIVAMTTYLMCMMLQVFLYCYQGNQLTLESEEIGRAAYECPWYRFSIRLRRALLLVMVRTRRPATLTAGKLTQLSLATFAAIIKLSYTFFTVLQNVENRNA